MNTNLKRYYLHTLLQDLVSAKGSFFTMAYFYTLGLSASGVILATVIYGITALIMLRPIAWLVSKIGVKSTFMLHLIPLFLKYIVTINVTPDNLYYVYIINFIHAISLMLYRIPVTAYFSRFGDNHDRGKELSYNKLLNGLTGISFALFFGSLLDHRGFALVITLQTIVNIIASLVLWKKDDPNLKLFIYPKTLVGTIVPKRVIQTFFVSHLPYAFTADLFFIWVMLQLGSFTLAGVFVALKIGVEMLLSYLVGYFSDKNKIKKIFYITVGLSSLFWLLVPFVHNGIQIFVLQFSLGLSGLILDIPVDREYHNLAKQSGDELAFSLARERSLTMGMIIGGIVAIGLIAVVKQWQLLLPLAILYPISRTLIFRKEKR